MTPKGTLERAFELARDGTCESVHDIRRKLTVEHYSNVDSHLAGPSVRRQLKALIGTSRPTD